MGEIGLSPFSSIAALFSFLSFLIALYNGCGICGYRLKCVSFISATKCSASSGCFSLAVSFLKIEVIIEVSKIL